MVIYSDLQWFPALPGTVCTPSRTTTPARCTPHAAATSQPTLRIQSLEFGIYNDLQWFTMTYNEYNGFLHCRGLGPPSLPPWAWDSAPQATGRTAGPLVLEFSQALCIYYDL